MSLFQLIYVSKRTPSLSRTLLESIVRDSEIRNRRCGATGVLLCCGEHIMQLLEGESDVVEPLFARISADPRHTAIERLLSKPVRRRLFPEWGMGLADLDKKGALDRPRLAELLETIRARTDTSSHSVEARVLLNDFRQQLQPAA